MTHFARTVSRMLAKRPAGFRLRSCSAVMLVLLLCVGSGQLPADACDEPTVAAVVNGQPISRSSVDRYLEKTTGKTQIPDQWLDRARGEALEHLIRRHAVLINLRKSGFQVGDSEIRLEFSKLEDRLKEVDQDLAEYLRKSGIDRKELEYEFEWRIAWTRYLAKHLTDQRLEQYYQRHRRRFDGSRMKVAHLLLRSTGENDGRTLTTRAEEIRDEISTGKISWTDAVAQHSDAASSASRGGLAGWISHDGPMPEAFCRAAFQLEPDQISSPVQTAFGIHLIKCLEIRTGKIGPRDAVDAVRQDAMQYLFGRLADQERDMMTVDYLVDWPGSGPARAARNRQPDND